MIFPYVTDDQDSVQKPTQIKHVVLLVLQGPVGKICNNESHCYNSKADLPPKAGSDAVAFETVWYFFLTFCTRIVWHFYFRPQIHGLFSVSLR